MDFVVRDVEDTDALDLVALVARCWAQYPGCVLDVHGEEPELLAPARAARVNGGRWWIAEARSRVVGSVAFEIDTVARLRKLYVDPTTRRHGLGERLVGLVEEAAMERGCRRIELWSDTRFADGHRLYERLGYDRQAETRTLGDLSNTIEYRFVKDLGSR